MLQRQADIYLNRIIVTIDGIYCDCLGLPLVLINGPRHYCHGIVEAAERLNKARQKV
jgi:hypothetical protein